MSFTPEINFQGFLIGIFWFVRQFSLCEEKNWGGIKLRNDRSGIFFMISYRY